MIISQVFLLLTTFIISFIASSVISGTFVKNHLLHKSIYYLIYFYYIQIILNIKVLWKYLAERGLNLSNRIYF